MAFTIDFRASQVDPGAAPGHGKGHRTCVGAAPYAYRNVLPGGRLTPDQRSSRAENSKMPLLAQEPLIHPETLLSDSAIPQSGDSRWWVLHTRPRAEKTLARRFWDRSVDFFLPQFQKEWCSRGRRLRSYLPLFPGYVFLHGDFQQRVAALETNLVVQVLTVSDQPQLHADLQRVYRLITTGAAITPEDRLEPGDSIRIAKGPLAGLDGKVIRRGTRLRLVVEIQMLNQAVSAVVESWMLESSSYQCSSAQ